jgi:hypothetical protein
VRARLTARRRLPVARILVGADGSATIEATSGGLLRVEDLPLDGPGLDGDPMFDRLVAGSAGRTSQVIAALPDRSEL